MHLFDLLSNILNPKFVLNSAVSKLYFCLSFSIFGHDFLLLFLINLLKLLPWPLLWRVSSYFSNSFDSSTKVAEVTYQVGKKLTPIVLQFDLGYVFPAFHCILLHFNNHFLATFCLLFQLFWQEIDLQLSSILICFNKTSLSAVCHPKQSPPSKTHWGTLFSKLQCPSWTLFQSGQVVRVVVVVVEVVVVGQSKPSKSHSGMFSSSSHWPFPT